MNARAIPVPALSCIVIEPRKMASFQIEVVSKLELMNFQQMGMKAAVEPGLYDARIERSTSGTIWAVLSFEDKVIGRPLTGWDKPIANEEAVFHFGTLEAAHVREIKKDPVRG